MNLNEWAIKWGVPYEAIQDLQREIGTLPPEVRDPEPKEGATEAAVQSLARLEASEKGHRLMRNNVGAGYLGDGSFIRWGLMNDSKKVNKKIKSSDLIGIRQLLIEPYHVGTIVGQFMARECKHAHWQYRGTPEEEAQLTFLNLVLSLGGDAAFCTQPGTI